jgi:hypothetical protein
MSIVLYVLKVYNFRQLARRALDDTAAVSYVSERYCSHTCVTPSLGKGAPSQTMTKKHEVPQNSAMAVQADWEYSRDVL